MKVSLLSSSANKVLVFFFDFSLIYGSAGLAGELNSLQMEPKTIIENALSLSLSRSSPLAGDSGRTERVSASDRKHLPMISL